MPEIIRARDCVVFHKSDSQTVVVSQAMVNAGWPGGQGVQWSGATADERVVTYSQGLFGGILVWGSNEAGDDFASMTRSQPHYRYATMFTGSVIMATSSYERYTYASRTGGGPLVPLVYSVEDALYFSRRGLWTNEDEMTLAGDPLAPALLVAYTVQVPKRPRNCIERVTKCTQWLVGIPLICRVCMSTWRTPAVGSQGPLSKGRSVMRPLTDTWWRPNVKPKRHGADNKNVTV